MSEPMTLTKRPRLLWVGDAVAQTGFARVTHNVVGQLHEAGWEVAVLGINHRGDPHPYPYPIFPAVLGGDVWGVGRLADLVRNMQPNVIVINNDPWNIEPYLQVLEEAELKVPVLAYMPVDGANIASAPTLRRLHRAIAYTVYGKKELAFGGYTGRCDVIPHGVDTELYRPIGKAESLRKLGLTKNVPDDSFVVGNVNRNQPRKRLDLTIQHFAKWWVMAGQPRNAFLYLHCSNRDIGWNVLQLATYYGINKRTIITNPKMTPENTINEEMMPFIYGTFDVQVSTTMGEGWGLTQHEGMACGIPQIVPDYSALGEWTKDAAWQVPCSSFAATPNGINTIGGIVDETKFIEALDFFYNNPNDRAYWATRALDRAREERFTWTAVAAQFDHILRETLMETSPRGHAGLQEAFR